MNKSKIYVGNLSYDTTEDGLRNYFTKYGNIVDIKLITDYQTGRSKGFGFITFSSDAEGEMALGANGIEFGGRTLNVNTARDSEERRNGGGSSRNGNRGGRNGGGRYAG